MGLFSKLFGTRIDWSTDPIPGDPQWRPLEAPRPDSLATAREAVRRSGVDPADVDLVECLIRVWNLIIGLADQYFRSSGQAAVAEAMGVVSTRSDLSDELLWNFFSHHQATGVAVQRQIAGVFASGQAAEAVASLIREGECRIALGGRDRI